MSKAAEKVNVADVRRATQIDWSQSQLELHALTLPRRRQRLQARRKRAQRVAAMIAVLCAGSAVHHMSRNAATTRSPPPQPVASAVDPRTVVLTPEVTAVPVAPNTQLVVMAATKAGVTVRLNRGSARFERTSLARPLQVHTQHFQVVVQGMAVTMWREQSTQALWVEVHDGHADVARADGSVTTLAAGEKRRFLPSVSEAPAVIVNVPAVAPKPSIGRSQPWRALAAQGAYEEAYRSLRQAGVATVRDDVDDLLLAADAARLSGHADKALGFLDRIRKRHGNDPRSSMAAFTAGSLLLHHLKQPQLAAAAFAEARLRDGAQVLSEDALAREVQSWSRAGERLKAEASARLYLQTYPHGRWSDLVREFGHVK